MYVSDLGDERRRSRRGRRRRDTSLGSTTTTGAILDVTIVGQGRRPAPAGRRRSLSTPTSCPDGPRAGRAAAGSQRVAGLFPSRTATASQAGTCDDANPAPPPGRCAAGRHLDRGRSRCRRSVTVTTDVLGGADPPLPGSSAGGPCADADVYVGRDLQRRAGPTPRASSTFALPVRNVERGGRGAAGGVVLTPGEPADRRRRLLAVRPSR